MPSFALITEGLTDQVILEHILAEYYEASDGIEIDVNHIQPLRDETDSSRLKKNVFGGWEKVLEFCTVPHLINDCMAHNDYTIIQIDTDCAEHPNFGVPLTNQSGDRSVEEVIADTKSLIIRKIGSDLYDQFADRFLFAIAIHSLECWILSLHTNDPKHPTKNCEGRLKTHLARNGKKYAKEYHFYRTLTKPIKGKDIVKMSGNATSLTSFFTSLPSLSTAK